MLTGTQKRRGFREVLFNHKTNGFYAPLPGDNYEVLPIQSGDGGTISTFGTGDINLETPTVTVTSLPDASGLTTQQDFNIWAVAALESLASSGDGGGGGAVGGIDEVLTENNVAAPNQTLRFNDPDFQPLVDAGIIEQDDINPDLHSNSNHRALFSRWGLTNSADQYTNQAYMTAYGLTLDRPTSDFEWGSYLELMESRLNIIVKPRDGTTDEGSLSGLYAIRVAINDDSKFTVTNGGSCKATKFILTSPNGTEYALAVADDGTLSTTAV